MRTGGDLYGSYYYSSGSYSGGINSGTTSTDVVQLVSSHADGTNYKIFTNGGNEVSATLLGTPDSPTDGVFLGNTSAGSRGLDGHLLEVILYASDETGNRADIEENIGDYFTQNTPLLDTYSGAAAAYSLRLLDSTYTGSAVEVYNGSSYADIGFNVFGELDTVALAAHCGSNDGFVSKWYDQSSNSNDATQTTTANMPKIYDGTTGVVTYNSKPCVEFNGSSQYLDGASHSGTAFSMLWTGKQDATSNSNRPFGLFADDGTTQKVGFSFDSDYSLRYDGAASTGSLTPTTSAQILRFATRLNDAQTDHVNTTANINTTTALVSITASSISIGNAGIARNTHFNGFTHEAIMWDSDQSSNRTNIESNINTFYSIY